MYAWAAHINSHNSEPGMMRRPKDLGGASLFTMLLWLSGSIAGMPFIPRTREHRMQHHLRLAYRLICISVLNYLLFFRHPSSEGASSSQQKYRMLRPFRYIFHPASIFHIFSIPHGTHPSRTAQTGWTTCLGACRRFLKSSGA